MPFSQAPAEQGAGIFRDISMKAIGTQFHIEWPVIAGPHDFLHMSMDGDRKDLAGARIGNVKDVITDAIGATT